MGRRRDCTDFAVPVKANDLEDAINNSVEELKESREKKKRNNC